MFRKFFTLLLILFSTAINAQEKAPEKVSEKISTEPTPLRLPIVGIGIGMLNFNGDVGYNQLNEPLTARSGIQFEIQQQTDNKMSFGLFILSGKMIGEEKTISQALNFKATTFSECLFVRYDFKSNKRSDQILTPFLSAGIEYLVFNSKTDLVDEYGRAYQYWDDGTIRDIAQNDVNADQSVLIHRDYNYETNLKDANLDGLGNYSTSTWAVPVGAGVRFRISDRCSFDLSTVCHFTGTDYIDGVTADGKGQRKGNDKNDKMFYSSISFHFALSSDNGGDYNKVDFNALVNEDADGDGIPDINDDSSGTPKNNAVNSSGKPFDADNDGIPDYRDQEPNSAKDAVVTEDGVTITEEMIEAKFRKDSLAALPAVIEYLKSYDKLTKRNPDVEKKWLEKNGNAPANGENPIPPLYRNLDIDKNGIITPKEISLAIDDYLAKRSNYTVSEFFDLIDFFFSQK